MKKINIGINTIDKIYHISDIHIRNLKRHQEYKQVFNKTANYIKNSIGNNDIIFLGGDIVHAKTDMTPELVQEVQEFFKLFADIAPTILITGNHDCNLNNISRLDALTPIVNALQHPNLFYFKDSGIYHVADKHFVVMSVFDKPKDFIKADSFEADYKIALHHGAVNNAVTDVGFTLVNHHVDIHTFDDYDITLLGDIHKPAQFLNNEKTIAYCGSLIQQGFGESLIHGILVWDTKTRSAKFVEIENDTCYYNLDINGGKYEPITKTIKDKSIKLRVRSQNTDAADIKKIIADIRLDYNIEECTIQKINDFVVNKSKIHKINIGDVRDTEYQNELISKHLENKFAFDDSMLDGIRHVNRTVNSSLKIKENSRNILWIPKKFEFSNMFSYGENNLIDFSNITGVCGLFAPNASGKSTMLDAIAYCIFDKCSRTSKASSVLNNKSDYFTCTFNFQINDTDYFIEKKGTKGRGNHVRVDIDFYSIDEYGQRKSLNGKERSDTNDNIRQLLGTYDDFVLTTLSAQNNNTGFIEMAQRERKDLLSQFLDINIFEELYTIASNDIKEVATLIKEYQRQDLSTQLANSITNIDRYSNEHKLYTEEKNDINQNLEKLNREILKLTSDLINIDVTIEDINLLNREKDRINKLFVSLEDDGIKKRNELITIQNNINELKDKHLSYNINLISEKINKLSSVKEEEKQLLSKIAKLRADLNHKLEKMKKLNDLEYDENCSYCMNNIFVKDAIATKSSIQIDLETVSTLEKQIETIQLTINELAPAHSEKDLYNKLQNDIHLLESNKSSIELKLQEINSYKQQLDNKLKTIDVQIEEYYKTESAILSNKLVKSKIDDINKTVTLLKTKLIDVDKKIISCYSNLLLAEKTKTMVEESIAKLKELGQKFKYYEYYLLAVSRDGVPYDLITSAVPLIEQEINNILSQIVDFQLMLEMDGRNINCYIVYDDDNFWPIELTSGMEKFVSSLAIRTALINVSALPRPNFLAIDEGFGSLDSENLNSMFNLFDYLKTQFSFILVISHIDSMRDVVDKSIEITKLKGNSNIYYS
jgi:DNA repair exonuclease SbcCD ATPase subunit/predicted MPP superfamily phosphohydrolase